MKRLEDQAHIGAGKLIIGNHVDVVTTFFDPAKQTLFLQVRDHIEVPEHLTPLLVTSTGYLGEWNTPDIDRLEQGKN